MPPSSEGHVDEICLTTDGASVVFRLRRLDSASGYVEFDLHVEIDSDVGAVVPPRRGCRLHLRDLDRLVEYMTLHMGSDEPHGILKSGTFVSQDLDFQLQALDGEAEGLSDGYFCLRWMVYCGPPDRDRRNVYAGFESSVGTEEVLRWCRELRSVRARLGGESS